MISSTASPQLFEAPAKMRALVAGHDMGGINLLVPLLRHWMGHSGIEAHFLGDPTISREVSQLVPGVSLAAAGAPLSDWTATRTEELDVYLDALFSTLSFDVAICATSAHAPLERRVLAAAKRWSVPSVAYCDMWWAYSERFFDGREWTLPDRLWVVDEQMARQASAVDWPGALAIDLIGSTLFGDRHLRRITNRSSGRRSIRFVSEPASTKFPEARVDEFSLADILAQECSKSGLRSGLIVRPHPSDSMEAWRRWSFARRHLDVTLDTLPLEEAIADTSHAVGLSSILLGEMSICGVRVASFQPPEANPEYYCLPFRELGISVVCNAVDLSDWLRSDPVVPVQTTSLHNHSVARATELVLSLGGHARRAAT